MRRSKPFALAYACASFAIDTGITPEEQFGKVHARIRIGYDLFVSQNLPRNSADEVKAFLADKSNDIFQCPASTTVEMSDRKFSTYDAFVIEARGTKCLAITSAKLEEHFPSHPELLEDLAAFGLLVMTEGRQFKKRIRSRNGKTVNDRFYVISVSKWPKHLT